MSQITLDALDLGALLCSRVCHDVISPVGAIVNGLEVLNDEKDESMRDFAHDLIRKSAATASARLQFARLAFGAAGSAGATIDLGDAEQVARQAPRILLPKNQVKLLLNMLVIAQSTIPRGGVISASVSGEGETLLLKIVAQGTTARIPPALPSLLKGESETGTIDSHSIQPYYASLIAKAEGLHLTLDLEGDVATLIAKRT